MSARTPRSQATAGAQPRGRMPASPGTYALAAAGRANRAGCSRSCASSGGGRAGAGVDRPQAKPSAVIASVAAGRPGSERMAPVHGLLKSGRATTLRFVVEAARQSPPGMVHTSGGKENGSLESAIRSVVRQLPPESELRRTRSGWGVWPRRAILGTAVHRSRESHCGRSKASITAPQLAPR